MLLCKCAIRNINRCMIFIVSVIAFFLLRLVFRMAGGLLLVGLVVWLVCDESVLRPAEVRQVWKAISDVSRRAVEFAQSQAAGTDQVVVPMQRQVLPANRSERPMEGYY